MRRRTIGALAITVALVGACGQADLGVRSTRSEDAPGGLTPPTAPGTTVPGSTGPGPTGAPPTTGVPGPGTTNRLPATSSVPRPGTTVRTTDTTPKPANGVISFGSPRTPKEYDNYLDTAFVDITRWWTANFGTIYPSTFRPVNGIYAHTPTRSDPIPSCQGPVGYKQAEMNAFYTNCGDIIVYDDARLFPALYTNLGGAALAVVAAHEYGHAVQERGGVFRIPGLNTVDTEQQADCFAGAWVAHMARGESNILRPFGDADIKAGIMALIEVRDPPGSDVTDDSGHGTAFDRVGAFQEGFINGLRRCAQFPTNPNPRIDLQFTESDVLTEGNLPYDEILEFLPETLRIYWEPALASSNIPFTPPGLVSYPSGGPYPSCNSLPNAAFPSNAIYCANNNTIVFDENYARRLYTRFGDMALSYPIAAAYADAVQVALNSRLSGEPRVLLNDCLVGTWLRDIVPAGIDAQGRQVATNPDQPILLSAGDLDEIVLTAVEQGDPTTDTNRVGTTFEKIDAFRTGVLNGIEGCERRLG